MDQKRLFLAIAISVAILLGFQLLIAPHLPQPPKPPPQVAGGQSTQMQAPNGPSTAAAAVTTPKVPKEVPRVQIAAPRLQGLHQPAGRAAG